MTRTHKLAAVFILFALLLTALAVARTTDHDPRPLAPVVDCHGPGDCGFGDNPIPGHPETGNHDF